MAPDQKPPSVAFSRIPPLEQSGAEIAERGGRAEAAADHGLGEAGAGRSTPRMRPRSPACASRPFHFAPFAPGSSQFPIKSPRERKSKKVFRGLLRPAGPVLLETSLTEPADGREPRAGAASSGSLSAAGGRSHGKAYNILLATPPAGMGRQAALASVDLLQLSHACCRTAHPRQVTQVKRGS